MRIDFSSIPEEAVQNFCGGNKTLFKRAWSDGKAKIMYDRLPAGASIGMHTHETNSETMYLLSGVARYTVDGVQETVRAGEAHYCPKGSTHCMENIGDDEIAFFAVVAEQ